MHSLEPIQIGNVKRNQQTGKKSIHEHSPLVMARARHTTGSLAQFSVAFKHNEESKKGLVIDASPQFEEKKRLANQQMIAKRNLNEENCMGDNKKELHDGKMDCGEQAAGALQVPSLKRTNPIILESEDENEEWFDDDEADDADEFDCSEPDDILGEERLPNQINLSRAVDNQSKMAPGAAAVRLYNELHNFDIITERLTHLPAHQETSFYSLKGNESSQFSFDEKSDNRGIAKVERSVRIYQKKLDKLIVKKTTDPDSYDGDQKERRLKRIIWMLNGVRNYNHERADLLAVIAKLKKVKMVPDGYHYPELNRIESEPEELKGMKMRKEMHLAMKSRNGKNQASN